MNVSVCSVISCLEVSSTDYLIATNKHVRLQCDIEVKQVVLKVSLETPPKEQKLGKKVALKLHSE